MRAAFAPAIVHPNSASLLSVSANDEDHAFFADRARTDPEWTLNATTRWDVCRAFTIPSALHSLRGRQIPVLVCTDDLAKDTWQELLEKVLSVQDPPSVILASRLADDRLWAEAINLGAYDVLAKPFDGNEVMRVVTAAWASWLNQQERKKRQLVEKWAVDQWNAAAG